MERENFISEIINSVDGIVKVSPNDYLFQNIENQINDTLVSPKYYWLVAASITLLFSLNVLLISKNYTSEDSEFSSFESSINQSNQLYK